MKLVDQDFTLDVRDIEKGQKVDLTGLFTMDQLLRPVEFLADSKANVPIRISVGDLAQFQINAYVRVQKGERKPLARGFIIPLEYTKVVTAIGSGTEGSKVRVVIETID